MRRHRTPDPDHVDARRFEEDRSELWKVLAQSLIYCVIVILVELIAVCWTRTAVRRADIEGISFFLGIIIVDGVWCYLSWMLSRKVCYIVSPDGIEARRGNRRVVYVSAGRVAAWELEPPFSMWSELFLSIGRLRDSGKAPTCWPSRRRG